MVYEVIGFYPATDYFMVESDSGVVRTIDVLRNDPLKLSSYLV